MSVISNQPPTERTLHFISQNNQIPAEIKDKFLKAVESVRKTENDALLRTDSALDRFLYSGDLLIDFFSKYFSQQELLRIARVSKHFYDCVHIALLEQAKTEISIDTLPFFQKTLPHSADLMRSIPIRFAVMESVEVITNLDLSNDTTLSDSTLKNLALEFREKRSLKKISLKNCHQISNVGVIELVRNCPFLREIDLSGSLQISDIAVQEIAEQCSHLTVIKLGRCRISDQSLQALAKCRYLEEADLSACHHISPAGVTRLGDQGAIPLLSKCKRLKKIDISGSDITDEALSAFKDMQKVELSGCTRLSNQGVVRLSKNSSAMTFLNLSCCGQITDENWDLITSYSPQLISIDLNHCTRITDTTVRNLIKLTCLQELSLNYSKITDTYLGDFKHLCSLRIAGCQTITDEGLSRLVQSSPELSILDVSFCSHCISDRSIEMIAQGFPNLKELHFTNCLQVTSKGLKILAHNSPFLENVSLVGNAPYPYIAIGLIVNCPRLREIKLDFFQYKTVSERERMAYKKQYPELIKRKASDEIRKQVAQLYPEIKGLVPYQPPSNIKEALVELKFVTPQYVGEKADTENKDKEST